MMEEALMDPQYLRRRILERRLVEYVSEHPTDGDDRLFDTGPEFGVALLCCMHGYSWAIDWLPVEECPVEIPTLKGD